MTICCLSKKRCTCLEVKIEVDLIGLDILKGNLHENIHLIILG